MLRKHLTVEMKNTHIYVKRFLVIRITIFVVEVAILQIMGIARFIC